MKNEALFNELANSDYPRTGEGAKQFHEHQSRGIKPSSPDPYYLKLVDGKRTFDFLFSEYRKMYMSGHWWGFHLLWLDWEGKRWVLPHLCGWYPKLVGRELPVWLGKEVSEEERSQMNINENLKKAGLSRAFI